MSGYTDKKYNFKKKMDSITRYNIQMVILSTHQLT